MGLDMYLTKKNYVGAYYEHNNVKGKIEITVDGEPLDIDFGKVSEIIERVGYWRKANQIHNWFVENVQGGRDECQESYVTAEQLKKLLAECEEVLEFKDKAEDIMPSVGGYFFGGEGYDEWYFQDIEETIEMLKPLVEAKVGDIYYQASW